jgi:hypothetical protein
MFRSKLIGAFHKKLTAELSKILGRNRRMAPISDKNGL